MCLLSSMTYPNFLRRSFQLPWILFYSEKIEKIYNFFKIFVPYSLPKCQALLFQNKENSHELAFVV